MPTDRLDVRLGQEYRRKLRELSAQYEVPVSETIRRLIDAAYEETLKERRRRAARKLGRMRIEDVPDPDVLSRQLEGAHDPGGIH